MLRKPSPPRAERVVKYTKADGTKVEKRYPAYDPAAATRPSYAQADTVAALIAAYERSPDWRNLSESSKRNKLTALRHLVGFNGILVADIRRRHLIETRDAVASGFGQGAASDFAAAVTKLFSFAEDSEWIQVNPARKLSKGLVIGELPPWLEEEYEAARDSLPERLRRVVVLARYTAQRRGDLCKMAWSDIWTDSDGFDWLHVVQEKTGEEIDVPVLPELAAEFAVWRQEGNVVGIAGVRPGTILEAEQGRAWRGPVLSTQLGIYLARIPGFPVGRNVHGLRKLALTDLAERGGTLHELKAFGGHRTLAMVQHYTKGADQMRNARAVRAKLTERG